MSNKLLKILVPLCMALGVFGLWFMQEQKENTHELTAASHNSDFALLATHIDLEALKKLNVPIIIDFGADSCIPCKEMAPILVKLNMEMQNKALIKFVDVWKNPQGAEGFPVQVIPTQLIFNADGTPYTPKDANNMQFTMYADKETQKHIFTVHQGGLTEEQMRHILKEMGV